MLPSILDGTPITPTSSFPYVSIGPVDFSNVNFVQTCQTDYYYGYPDGSSTVESRLSKVVQCNEPLATFWTIMGISFIFVGMMVTFTWLFAHRRNLLKKL